MANKDLFAPPSDDELKMISGPSDDPFAPPTQAELSQFGRPTEEVEMPKYNELESAGMGAVNQLGLAPAVAGALETGYEAYQEPNKEKISLDSLLASYRSKRDAVKEKFKEAEEANPKSYLAGNVAGGLALPIPGASTKGLGALLARGAGIGAAAGIASSEGDLTRLDEPEQREALAKDAAMGAGFGLAGESIGRGLRGIADKAGPYLKEKGSELASKVYGLNKTLASKELGSQMAGRSGIGETLIEKGLLKPGASAKSALGNVNDMIDKQAEATAGIRSEAAKALQLKNVELPKFDDELAQVKDKFARQLEGVAGGEEKYNQISRAIDNVAPKFNIRKNDIEGLNDLKQNIYKQLSNTDYIKNSNEIPEMTELNKTLANILKKRTETMAEAAQPGLGAKLQQANSELGNLMDAQSSIKTSAIKDLSSGSLGTAARYAAEQGLKAGSVATFRAGQGFEKAAPAIAGAGKMAEALGRTPTNLMGFKSDKPAAVYSQMPPEVIQEKANKYAMSQDPKEQELARMLSNLAAKPARERDAMIFSLMQQPQYRKMLNE